MKNIKEQCDNLEINDIPDVTEEKYDNKKIIEEKKEVKSQSMIEQFIESLKPREKPKENLVSIVKEPDKERLEKERMEQERVEKERMEQERLNKERLEQEKINKKRLEKERLEKERLNKERLEQERLEQERLEKERLEKED